MTFSVSSGVSWDGFSDWIESCSFVFLDYCRNSFWVWFSLQFLTKISEFRFFGSDNKSVVLRLMRTKFWPVLVFSGCPYLSEAKPDAGFSFSNLLGLPWRSLSFVGNIHLCGCRVICPYDVVCQFLGGFITVFGCCRPFHSLESFLLKAIKSASSAWNFSQSVLAMSLSFVLPNPEHGLQENAIKWWSDELTMFSSAITCQIFNSKSWPFWFVIVGSI